MGLIRLLILIAIIWLLVIVVRRLLASGQHVAEKRQARLAENMVRCELCGLHVPEKEAVRRGTHLYCSESHRDTAR